MDVGTPSHKIRCNLLLSFISDNDFVVLNGRTPGDLEGCFSFCGSQGLNKVDFVWGNCEAISKVNSLRVNDVSFQSDHFPLCLELLAPKPHRLNGYSTPQSSPRDPPSPQSAYTLRWEQDLLLPYTAALRSLPNLRLANSLNEPTTLYDTLCTAISEAAADCGMVERRCLKPTKGLQSIHHRWEDSEIKALKNSANRAQRTLRRKKFDPESVAKFHQLVKEYRLCRKRKINVHHRTLKNRMTNVKKSGEFWSTVKSIRSSTFTPNGVSKDKWKQFYTGIYPPRTFSDPLISDIADSFLDTDISHGEVVRALKNSKCVKAPGPDGITNKFLKNLPQEWVVIVAKLQKNAWKEEKIPVTWPSAALAILFKKGDPSDPLYYRGIALTNNILKLYTGILHSHLETWLNSQGILPEEQAGFRCGRSCLDQSFSLFTAVQSKMRLSGSTIYLIFMDFRRAFDSVPHHLLWKKLGSMKVSGKILRVLANIYDNAAVRVRLGSEYTHNLGVTEGVLQGDKLSSLLFITYIADFIEFHKRKNIEGFDIHGRNLRALLYADETVHFARSLSDARYNLKCLSEYFDANGLIVHTGKTDIMVCRPSGRIRSFEKSSFLYKGLPVKTAKQYTYLGTTLESAMNGRQAASAAMQKTRIAIGTANSILRRSKGDDWHSRIKLFDSLVSATLLYGIQTWEIDHLDEIERIPTDYFKRIFLLPRNTPGYLIRFELGTHPLALRALLSMWDWVHVLKMNQ
ncbi:uncharacterized protein LOC107039348 [Diachasma alloeum]|uniref:uncharacterized protein LOC107039348 n=1 Tax=Diachasma alloeum TaxID=454923 RepID=UPI0007381EFC|nr:uncharacterized protein LOC107039348 [Diachasma alloeum]